MAVNGFRGEVEIELAGRKMVMRPTFQAMIEIEHIAGMPLAQAANELFKSFGEHNSFQMDKIGLTYEQIVDMVGAGLKASGEPVARDKLGEIVMETGLPTVAPLLCGLLLNMLTGGKPAGEVKAPETKAD